MASLKHELGHVTSLSKDTKISAVVVFGNCCASAHTIIADSLGYQLSCNQYCKSSVQRIQTIISDIFIHASKNIKLNININ